MAIDATVGGISANSYVTVAEADAYFANRVFIDAWDNVDSKESALITATLRLDQEDFDGDRASETQALKWPRSDTFVDEIEILSTIIPVQVKAATCELALTLSDTNILAPTGLENFKALSVGPISMTLNPSTGSGSLPAQVARLLRGIRLYAVLA